MTCTFFGHRDTPTSVQSVLHEVLTDLIENQGADTFYVGNQGSFDFTVRSELKKLSVIYPHIKYSVVLAYMPKSNDGNDYSDTEYPEGLENVPPRFAIDKRNRIMIDRSDFVITYVCTSFGGAAKYKEIAEKKGKKVINLI